MSVGPPYRGADEFPVYASHGVGTVVAVKDGTVTIDHDNGYTTRHFHLHDIRVQVGDRIAWGQLLGQARV